jgi:hypothetical protein
MPANHIKSILIRFNNRGNFYKIAPLLCRDRTFTIENEVIPPKHSFRRPYTSNLFGIGKQGKIVVFEINWSQHNLSELVELSVL